MSLAYPTDLEDHRLPPVSVDDLKESLRIDHNEQDRLILRAILGATAEAESHIGTAIIARSFDLVVDAFPGAGEGIALPNPPIRSVVSISYFDSAGVSQVIDPANYTLLRSTGYPRIQTVPGAAWPQAQARPDAVLVRYLAGFAEKPSAVPAAIAEAVSLRAVTRFEMPQEAGTGAVSWTINQALAFERMLAPYMCYPSEPNQ